jgi:dTDP-4-amino-4,6-dideoxygalactose transaminase
MRKNGYNVNIHYIPIHLQPYYKKLGFKKGMYPVAEKYYNETLSIPIFPDLKKKEQINIIKLIKNSFKNLYV